MPFQKKAVVVGDEPDAKGKAAAKDTIKRATTKPQAMDEESTPEPGRMKGSSKQMRQEDMMNPPEPVIVRASKKKHPGKAQ